MVCSSCHPQSLGGIDRAAADFHELGERAAKRNLRVGFEALAWGHHINDHRDAWEVVRRADHENVGVILDSFHTLSRKIDPDSIRSIPGNKIFFIQLADAPLIDMDLLYWSRHFRNMPGEGDLAVGDFMKSVTATGYSGPVSLEIFNDQFRAGPAKMIAKDGYRSLIALQDDVTRDLPAPVQTHAPLPSRSTVEGVSFIEFATRGDEAKALETILETLGFAPSGHHIAKDLTAPPSATLEFRYKTPQILSSGRVTLGRIYSISRPALENLKFPPSGDWGAVFFISLIKRAG